jgi:purine-binding chemotaxis protein CheW
VNLDATGTDKEVEVGTTEVLIFQLDQQKFALEIDLIREIIRFRESTSVPNTPGFLEGIISFRGRMVPVINGRKRLGLRPIKPDAKTSIIVVRDGPELYGLLVDSALQVIPLQQNTVTQDAPKDFTKFVRGSFSYKNQNIYLMNLESFLHF